MTKEAQAHAAEDAKRKSEIETRNNADSMAYTAEKTLRDLGDKVPADVKSDIESKVAALRQVMPGQDVEAIRRRTEELAQAVQKIGERMYQAAGGGPGGPPPGGQPPPGEGEQKPPDEGTVEGEFREV